MVALLVGDLHIQARGGLGGGQEDRHHRLVVAVQQTAVRQQHGKGVPFAVLTSQQRHQRALYRLFRRISDDYSRCV